MLSYNSLGEIINTSDIVGLKLKGHTWSVMGDSISVPNLNDVNVKYWNYINNRVGGMTIYNYGVSAERITNFTQRYANMHYSDIITVFGGVNDWGQNNPTPLGTITDSTNATFYGALNILCNGLETTFPQSLIIFITPLGSNGFNSWPTDKNSLNLSIYDYAKAIINVCAKFKIPVVDACSNSLLNPQVPNVKSNCFVDGLHLNTKGHEILSELIKHEMIKHYIPTLE